MRKDRNLGVCTFENLPYYDKGSHKERSDFWNSIKNGQGLHIARRAMLRHPRDGKRQRP